MRLPFGKKKSETPGTPNSAPGRSAPTSTAPKVNTKKGVPETAVAQPRRKGNHWENQWQHPSADPGLPGICGYLNGVQKPEVGDHPSRFVYVRPDGQPDDTKNMHVGEADPDKPLRPSLRAVPRGYFGP